MEALWIDSKSDGFPGDFTMPRVTVDFSPEANAAISEIAEGLGTTKSEALRKALGLMKFIVEERKKGTKLILDGPDPTDRREIIQL